MTQSGSHRPGTTRRRFLATATLALPGLPLYGWPVMQPDVSLIVSGDPAGPRMAHDFIGLSYEVEQLTDPSFFSVENKGLVRCLRELSSTGVLRLGGNTSEFGYWKPTPSSPEPKHPPIRQATGEPKANFYPVTPESVRNLAGFLKATGWSCLYGINMGTNTPERAADEAAFVAKTLGSSLQYFQVGNEVDDFGYHLRDLQTWSPKTYLAEWLQLARAIQARVPDARFGMPDIASHMDWLPALAELIPASGNLPHITTLSHHHYFGGPATNPEVTIPNMLGPAETAKVQRDADTATAAAAKLGLRVRMTEGNTCYRGGKPGLSDVFASALWSANYALLLASNNYSGINLHGGTGDSVANSVGGFLPGDELLKAQGKTDAEISSYPHPFYTPVAAIRGEYRLEPVAYGLMFAGLLSGGSFLRNNFADAFDMSKLNLAAYAVRTAAGLPSLLLLNKEPERAVTGRSSVRRMRRSTGDAHLTAGARPREPRRKDLQERVCDATK